MFSFVKYSSAEFFFNIRLCPVGVDSPCGLHTDIVCVLRV